MQIYLLELQKYRIFYLIALVQIKIITKMDSTIFQIKINQNKLQKILNQLCKQQLNLSEEIKSIITKIQNVQETQLNNKKHLESQIQLATTKVMTNIKDFAQTQDQSIRLVKKNISQTAETVFLKHSQLQEIINNNLKSTDQANTMLDEKINQVNDKIAEQARKQTNQKQELLQKIDNLQKTVNKALQSTQILKNKNFLYFLQMLVDKQVTNNIPGLIKSPQILKQRQLKNPFAHETNEQKNKRFKDIKKALHETHCKIQTMQCQYTQYFNSANENNKQNRQQTHLHYAFLSSKIKQLQNKLQEQQINNIQTHCGQKVLYPTQRNKKTNSRKDNETGSSCDIKSKQQLMSMIKDDLNPIKNSLQQFIKSTSTKFENMQDQVWKNNSQMESFKKNLTTLKTQFQRFNQKFRNNSYYAQLSNEKDHLNPRSLGEFINQFRNIQNDIEDRLHQKVDANTFKKSSQQITQKIKIINQQMDSKANKQQTRKAFNFIQQKIKQIVTIIADMQNSTKRTAGRKMILQCLSCDQNFFQQGQNQIQLYQPQTCRAISPRLNPNFMIKKDRKTKHNYTKSNMQA